MAGEKRKGWLVRIYAGTMAAALVVLLAAFAWYFSQANKASKFSGASDTEETKIVSIVSLDYVRREGQPADTYLYRTSDPEMIVIWVETRN